MLSPRRNEPAVTCSDGTSGIGWPQTPRIGIGGVPVGWVTPSYPATEVGLPAFLFVLDSHVLIIDRYYLPPAAGPFMQGIKAWVATQVHSRFGSGQGPPLDLTSLPGRAPQSPRPTRAAAHI